MFERLMRFMLAREARRDPLWDFFLGIIEGRDRSFRTIIRLVEQSRTEGKPYVHLNKILREAERGLYYRNGKFQPKRLRLPEK